LISNENLQNYDAPQIKAMTFNHKSPSNQVVEHTIGLKRTYFL